MTKKVFGIAVTTVLVVTAITLACWFIVSATTGATLILFRTGSMAPTLPQGSLAITVPVSASELNPGDVITVQRAGESMPITHRIVEVGPVLERADNMADIRAAAPGVGAPDLASADARQIVMQGDDNSSPDQLPYALTHAQRVVFGVPAVGTALMLLQSPLGTITMILLVGALVTWAFWPRTDPLATKHQPRHAEEVLQ